MARPFKGTINVDIRVSVPDWTPFEPPKAPKRTAPVVEAASRGSRTYSTGRSGTLARLPFYHTGRRGTLQRLPYVPCSSQRHPRKAPLPTILVVEVPSRGSHTRSLAAAASSRAISP